VYKRQPLASLKYDQLELGLNIECFHASEDKQIVRNQVFGIIANNLDKFRIDSLIVDKCKTVPGLQKMENFYPEMVGYLLRYVLGSIKPDSYKEIIVITDKLPFNKKRRAIEKAIKITLAQTLIGQPPYRVLHHEAKSCFNLQISDYCNWAIYRKYDKNDKRSYSIISSAIKSEFSIFRYGTKKYY